MQERILENLILKNENYVFDGNLTITSKLKVVNGSIIVSGKLFLKGISERINSISVINGNIIAHSLISLVDLRIYKGDIIVESDAKFAKVVSTGDIKVGGSCFANNVNCRNYLVSCSNTSDDVTTTEDIYILGYNDSGDLKAREIFLGSFSKFYPYGNTTVIAKHFECVGPIKNCRGMLIG